MKIEVSEEASNAIHRLVNEAKFGIGEKVKKGDIVAKLIHTGLITVMSFKQTPSIWGFPDRGIKSVQFKDDENKKLIDGIRRCAAHHNFKSEHFAARACLYSALSLPLEAPASVSVEIE